MRPGRRRSVVGLLAAVSLAVSACSGGSAPEPEVVARGEQLYATSCVQCHGGPTGGQISDIPPRHNAEGHTWHHSDCLLSEIVREGLPPRAGAEGDEVMPAFGDQLTEAEIEAILIYIKTWWTDEQRQSQAQVTAEDCDG